MLFKQNLRFILTSSAPLHFRFSAFSDFKCGYDVCGHIMRSRTRPAGVALAARRPSAPAARGRGGAPPGVTPVRGCGQTVRKVATSRRLLFDTYCHLSSAIQDSTGSTAVNVGRLPCCAHWGGRLPCRCAMAPHPPSPNRTREFSPPLCTTSLREPSSVMWASARIIWRNRSSMTT